MSSRGSSEGYRVIVVGASSLAGKELLSVLRDLQFPMSRVLEISSESDPELELPILDLDDPQAVGASDLLMNPRIEAGEIDVAFIAARPDPLPDFLTSASPGSARPLVIDLEAALAASGRELPLMALLDLDSIGPQSRPADSTVLAAHPASIVLSLLLLRLASRIEVSTAVAHVFSPVSHLGPRAIEELQKQTVSLLSFQQVPRTVFGAQLAFNLLPQLAGSGSAGLDVLQARVRGEIDRYLAGRAPSPALRLFQAPIFYSLAISLYVETAVAINPARAADLLKGEHVQLRRPSDPVSSPLEVTGSDDILIDPVVADSTRPNGLWIWAVADNLRLGAWNAAQIAYRMLDDGSGKKLRSASRKAGQQ